MKKLKIKKIISIFIVLCFIILNFKITDAQGTTSFTYTTDENGNFIKTQDAYIPHNTITNLDLKNPEDIFIDKDNNLYIADTGNKRIVKYSIRENKILNIVTNEKFDTPKGIFVTKYGELYVADAKAKAVFRFDKNLQLVKTYTKPKTPIFQDTNFAPAKVSVDNTGNLYIVGEGVYSGIIQISQENEFLGYFAVNKTNLTPMQVFQKIIFSKEQEDKLIDAIPNTFSNIFLDQNGIIYTTSMGDNSSGVKKHNTSGNNMIKENLISEEDTTDVYVDRRGIIYASSSKGYINIYSKNGEFIFTFGSSSESNDIAGLFTRLPSIAVDNNYKIWAIDGDKGYLQSFEATEYSQTIYKAMDFYEKGDYENSKNEWEKVLRLNQMSVLAHNGVGKALLREQEYEKAMVHFEVSGERAFFSEAFWEVRNEWLQDYLPTIIILFVLLLIAIKIINNLDKNNTIENKKREVSKSISSLPIIKDFYFSLKTPKKPFDEYYEVKRERKGTFIGASVIYIIGFISYMAYKTQKGYIYQFVKIEDMDINSIVIGFFAILILFIVCNYLVTSINDGVGSLKQVYMIPAYGSMPTIISMLIVIPLSYILVENEAFILGFIMQIGSIWSLITIFIGLQTVHDYSFKETILSLVMTALFMCIAAVMGIIITIMWEQLWQFILTVGKEFLNNVL